MKIYVSIFTFLIITCQVLSGQDKPDEVKITKKVYLGINAGLFLSKFVQGGDWTYAHYHTMNVTLETKYNAGFNGGLFLDIAASDRFALQPGIYYNHTQHDIEYEEWSRTGTTGTFKNANYNVSYSNANLNFLLKYSVGNKPTKVGFIAGPYVNMPFLVKHDGQITITVADEQTRTVISTSQILDNDIEDDINGGMGVLFGFRVDFPIKRDYLCTEMKIGKSFYNVLENPELKESFLTFSLIYLMTLK
jgi:hypothetical protein